MFVSIPQPICCHLGPAIPESAITLQHRKENPIISIPN